MTRPGWRPKLVALDIDGTLLDHEGRLPDHIRDSVNMIKTAGVRVVLSTGRGWSATQPIFDALELPAGPAVCSNGAVLVNYPPFELARVATFDPGPVIRRVLELAPNARIAVEVIGVGFRLNRAFPEGDLNGEMIFETVDELCAQPASRIIVRAPDVPQSAFVELADRIGMHGVSYAIGWSSWLDIAPEGINKASGLEQICTQFGIRPRDVLAIGDGFNDIEMLQWAGRGVAVGDAAPGVQEYADHVTESFAEGGTSNELRRWFVS